MEKYTQEKLAEQREEIIDLLRSTNRKGIDTLIKFLDESKYFFCWGSKRHHKYIGGLAEHSLGVCKIALSENKTCRRDSIIISTLLHDICKVSYNFPPEKEYYGHGTKSVCIIEDYLGFKLTDEEWRAIRFHMGRRSIPKDSKEKEQFEIAQTEELWALVHTSDCLDCGQYPKDMYSIVKNVINLLKL